MLAYLWLNKVKSRKIYLMTGIHKWDIPRYIKSLKKLFFYLLE